VVHIRKEITKQLLLHPPRQSINKQLLLNSSGTFLVPRGRPTAKLESDTRQTIPPLKIKLSTSEKRMPVVHIRKEIDSSHRAEEGFDLVAEVKSEKKSLSKKGKRKR
jgi:hypothetical protein